MGFDPEAIEIAREGEMAARRRSLGAEIRRLRNPLIWGGQVEASSLLNAAADLCALEVENSATHVWAVVHRCVTDTGVEPDDRLAAGLIAAVSDLLYHYCIAEAEGVYNSEVTRSGLSAEVIAGTGFHERVIGARQKMQAEIRLFARALRNQAHVRPSSQVFNVYAPVGAIQTGASAQAFVNQSLDGAARGELLNALESISAEIRDTSALTAARAAEISEVVEETRAELEKPKPNGALLWAKLSAVASIIRAVPVLEKGYELIRAIAAAHGITLP
jgi:hypothetical protein